MNRSFLQKVILRQEHIPFPLIYLSGIRKRGMKSRSSTELTMTVFRPNQKIVAGASSGSCFSTKKDLLHSGISDVKGITSLPAGSQNTAYYMPSNNYGVSSSLPNLVSPVSLPSEPVENKTNAPITKEYLPENANTIIAKANEQALVSVGNKTAAIARHPLYIEVMHSKKNIDISLDVLFSEKSVSILPLSPNQPAYLSKEEFSLACSASTLAELGEMGVCPEQLILLQNLFRGSIGENVAISTYMSARGKLFTGLMNMQTHIQPGIMDNMPPELVTELATISASKRSMLVYEAMALAKFNASQRDQLTYNFDKALDDSCYNNTPNANPDYTLKLRHKVLEYTRMGYDLKLIRGNKPKHDILRGCSDSLVKNVMEVHKNLDNQLSLLDEEMLSSGDKISYDSLKMALKDNIDTFSKTKDVDSLVCSYNDLRNTYEDFLIRNKVPMNLIADLSIDDIVLDPEIKAAYMKRFHHHFTSPDSSTLQELNKVAMKHEGSSAPSKKILVEFIDTLFP